jgi:hypothetical protein
MLVDEKIKIVEAKLRKDDTENKAAGLFAAKGVIDDLLELYERAKKQHGEQQQHLQQQGQPRLEPGYAQKRKLCITLQNFLSALGDEFISKVLCGTSETERELLKTLSSLLSLSSFFHISTSLDENSILYRHLADMAQALENASKGKYGQDENILKCLMYAHARRPGIEHEPLWHRIMESVLSSCLQAKPDKTRKEYEMYLMFLNRVQPTAAYFQHCLSYFIHEERPKACPYQCQCMLSIIRRWSLVYHWSEEPADSTLLKTFREALLKITFKYPQVAWKCFNMISTARQGLQWLYAHGKEDWQFLHLFAVQAINQSDSLNRAVAAISRGEQAVGENAELLLSRREDILRALGSFWRCILEESSFSDAVLTKIMVYLTQGVEGMLEFMKEDYGSTQKRGRAPRIILMQHIQLCAAQLASILQLGPPPQIRTAAAEAIPSFVALLALDCAPLEDKPGLYNLLGFYADSKTHSRVMLENGAAFKMANYLKVYAQVISNEPEKSFNMPELCDLAILFGALFRTCGNVAVCASEKGAQAYPLAQHPQLVGVGMLQTISILAASLTKARRGSWDTAVCNLLSLAIYVTVCAPSVSLLFGTEDDDRAWVRLRGSAAEAASVAAEVEWNLWVTGMEVFEGLCQDSQWDTSTIPSEIQDIVRKPVMGNRLPHRVEQV